MQPKELKLLKTKKGRNEAGLFIIEGEKFVNEIPADWQVVQYVFAQRYARENDISNFPMKYDIMRDSIFDSLADTVSPQGVLAVCKQKQYKLEDIPHNFILLGENLNDPGNIGALIRTAAAAGASGVILTTGDIYNPKVLRASAGAVLRLPIVTDVSLNQVFEYLKDTPTYAAHPRGDVLPYQLDLSKNFCLMVGNEAHGLTETAANMATGLVTLPMVNNTESLNASVAGSVLMYEAVRQRIGKLGGVSNAASS